MSQASKSELYQELKAAGVQFDKHFREYTTKELQSAVLRLRQGQATAETVEAAEIDPQSLADWEARKAQITETRPAPAEPVAGVKLSQEETPIRVDEKGLVWFQEEVRKPAFAKARGRRVVKYNDPGVRTVQHQQGEYTESYEMPGDQTRQMEARVTLPSYQVGIYRDPRFPFKIHVYNEDRGFDRQEVENFYGGRDLMPHGIKRKYVYSSLCYDIRTVVREIEAEYRDRVLKKELPRV